MLNSEGFRKAREVLFERNWTRGVLEDSEGRVCMMGAVYLAWGINISNLYTAPDHLMANGVIGQVMEAIGSDEVGRWNDVTGRHLNEVLEALDRAEKIALKEEEALR